jgi:PAS domain S-box-containing protein
VVEFGLLVFLLALGGVGFNLMRRSDAGPIAYWGLGALALLGAGICIFLIGDSSAWSRPVGNALGTLYPVLLLVGAMVFAGRRRPGWLITAALAVGLGRGLLLQNGYALSAHALGFLVEPTAAAAAAVVAFRATRGAPSFSWQHGLAPALAVMAGLDVASAIWLVAKGPPQPELLVGAWILGGSLTLALQIAAVSDRTRESLLRVRETLEERIEERTAELARSVSVLEEQIADRRAAEAALRQSEERYRILSELGSDYVFALSVDRDRNITFEWASAGMGRITGFGPDELDGHGWLKLVHPDDIEYALGQLEAVFEGRLREMEIRIFSKKHEVRWIHVLFHTTVRAGEDGVARIVGAVSDVTERKSAEEERRRLDLHLREVQRLESLGLLAGGIAHDFNNMLAVIRGNSRLALADLDAGISPRERLERIRSATEHATSLTEQMLTYSGRTPMTRRPLELSQLVLGTHDLLCASVGDRGRLELDLAEGMPPIEGDVTRIQQVLVNLVSNACDALGERGGTICVATGVRAAETRDLSGSFGAPDAAPGDYVILEVSDTGPGMDPKVQQRIFEPFFTTKSSGRGLGLAAVLGIVVAHRGVIRIESRPGGGTTFRVLFPCAGAAAEPRSDPRDPERPAGRGGKVLIVDDDESVLELAREFLERAGFEVLAALGGQAGIDLFRAQRDEIDAVVLDLVMPGVGGAEAFVEMLRIRPEIPIVVTSGYDKEKAAERFSVRGLSGFLYKPYEPDELVESVRKAIIGDPIPTRD